jgi:O-antigen/teichoic acid export membrane protein
VPLNTRNISTTTALQLFQIARYGTLILCSIILTKSGIGTDVIGHYETFLLVAASLSFFWVNGLTHTFLSVYNHYENKQKVIGQTALILISTSVLVAFVMFLLRTPIVALFKFDDSGSMFALLLLYFIFNNVSFLVDYILLAKNNTKGLLWLSAYHFIFQTALIAIPALFIGNFESIIQGLLIFIGVKFLLALIFIFRNSVFVPDMEFIKMYLQKSAPLIISFFLGGMSIYVDGIIVNNYYDKATFAIYQYGAREFPLSLLLANALSASLILKIGKNPGDLHEVKNGSLSLMHKLFPVGILLLISSKWLYPLVFNTTFSESYVYFNIYMLLMIPRLLFPHSVLLGLNRSKEIMMASIIEFVLNIVISLVLLQFIGLQGIAYGTVIAFLVNKAILLSILKKEGIRPRDYIPLQQLTWYTLSLTGIFIIFTYFL